VERPVGDTFYANRGTISCVLPMEDTMGGE